MSEKVRLALLVEETLDRLRAWGFEPGLTREGYNNIAAIGGFNRATFHIAFALAELALHHQPATVRQLMYRAQAAGIFPDTSDPYYDQTGRALLKLRRAGLVPYEWISDSTRRRLKPSSWSGLSDYLDSVRECYRKDLWAAQRDYVEVFVEKDAMAGVIEPVTDEFDIYLNVIRGQVSETFAWNVAEQLKRIEKPIFLYYLGDHDPAGLGIEASLRSKLERFVGKSFAWQRLAITEVDFANSDLLGFPVKRSGSWREYLHRFGNRCVEVDAIAPDEIRGRVRAAIERHINVVAWQKLQKTEKLESETLGKIADGFAA